jgi:F-type H+-transporting ATPase subunit b
MGDLGINGWNLIIQLIAFIIFVYLLWKYALGPITRVLDQRTERVRESMEAAQRMQQDLQATAARNEEVLGEARRQAQEILGQSRQQGEALIARAREAAEQQQEIFLTQARATLQAETEAARQQLRQEVAELAISAAAKIVRKELDPATQARLIQETLAEAAGTNPVA